VRDPYYREVFGAAAPYLSPGYFAAVGVFATLVVVAMFERRIALERKLAAAALMVSLTLSSFLVPLAGTLQQSAIKEAALLSRERKLEPVLWRLNAPSFSVYRGAPTATREPRPGDVVVTRARRIAELPPGTRYELLYGKLGIVMLRIR
jgi:hypothetical protein